MMHAEKRSITFRVGQAGHSHLPLRVRSVGWNDVDFNYHEASLRKWFGQIFWCAGGGAEFLLGGRTVEVNAGEIFVYYPGDVHSFRATSRRWTYYWLTLDHADIAAWLTGFGFEQRHGVAGDCPFSLFRRLRSCLLECTPDSERRAANIAHAILTAATSHGVDLRGNSIAEAARRLIDEHFADSRWGIADLADALKLHRTTLLRCFTRSHGLVPSQYLQNRRLQKALSLLRESHLQIQEVTALAGFSDANYLARAVHKATGMSPREFRRT